MEPQDDNGLFAQTGQDNTRTPDSQTEGQSSDGNGQIPTNEKTPAQDGGGRDVPSEDGMAEDQDDEDSVLDGETTAPASAI